MATARVVYIHLSFPTGDIQALSFPHADIERLTHSPIKWLRYSTFCFCGAKGYLSATAGGGIIDENVALANLAERYYYVPTDDYHLVDYEALDDRCMSSVPTTRCHSFRDRVFERDDGCVITRARSGCDAAHIIPKSKGSRYITWVLRDRASLYGQLPLSLQGDVDINCVENGMMLRKHLHALFGSGDIAFLKTPNFALAPSDIPRVEPDDMPSNRTTLQYIEEPIAEERHPLPAYDVRADWSRDGVLSPPPSILLDLMYGAAVVKKWGCAGLEKILEKQFQDDYSKVPAEHPTSEGDEENGGEDDENNRGGDDKNNLSGDNARDLTWTPGEDTQEERESFSSDASPGLLEAMDVVLRLSMLLKGNTPQSMAAESEKREKEQELRSQEHSSEKVREWLNSDAASTRPL